MSIADGLLPLFFPPPSDDLGFRQGTVIAFDLDNGENIIDVGGTQLVNVPLLNVVDSVSLLPGTIVALLTWKSSWWVIGRVIVAHAPGFGKFCVFENNGEGVCITKNGIDIFPPNPPTAVARIFSQHFDPPDQMWVEIIPPRTIGGSGDNRIILGGTTTDLSGSFSAITNGNALVQTTNGTAILQSTNGKGLVESTDTLDIRSTSNAIIIDAQGGQLQCKAQGSAFFDAQSGQVQLLSSTNQCFIDHTTTGSAANCFIGINGLILRSTSSRRYKIDIEDVHVDKRKTFALRPRTWRDRNEVQEDPNNENWYVGFIAEELEEIGLTQFIEYDENGQPDSIAYDRITVALIDIIKEQESRLSEIEDRLSMLDGRKSAISIMKVTQPRPKRKPNLKLRKKENLNDSTNLPG